MRRALLLAGLLSIAPSCYVPPAPPEGCVAARDSIAHIADSLRTRLDTARARLGEQIILSRLAEQQVKRYAAIVARDPSQSRFLVGWVHRAFTGVVP